MSDILHLPLKTCIGFRLNSYIYNFQCLIKLLISKKMLDIVCNMIFNFILYSKLKIELTNWLF